MPSHVYLEQREIPGADPTTFEPDDRCPVCGRDRRRCYWNTLAVTCNDEVPGNAVAFDGLSDWSPGSALVRGLDGLRVEAPDLKLSRGYLIWPANRGEVPLQCGRGKTGTYAPAGGLQPGRLYSLRRNREGDCAAAPADEAMVRGRADAPALWIMKPPIQGARALNGAGKDRGLEPRLQDTLPAGPRTLMVRCREVTRSEAIERDVELKVELAAGEIWELEPAAPYAAPDWTCAVRAVSRTARDAKAPATGPSGR
jgi:hypothetical protein